MKTKMPFKDLPEGSTHHDKDACYKCPMEGKKIKNNMSHNNTFGMIRVGETYMDKVEVGSKIKFLKEKQKYTVIASNRFYSVCTKPFNAKKTVVYTVIDWYNQLRGVENLIFGMGAETKKGCEEMLDRLTNAESNISSRNWCGLDIEFINPSHQVGWEVR